MQSAFGIDHGGISKAKTPRPPRALTRSLRRRGTAAQRRTVSQGTPSRSDAIKGKLNRIGEADISLKGIGGSLSGGAARASGFMGRHPGLTGTAAVGGGGAAGYKILSDKEPKKRRG